MTGRHGHRLSMNFIAYLKKCYITLCYLTVINSLLSSLHHFTSHMHRIPHKKTFVTSLSAYIILYSHRLDIHDHLPRSLNSRSKGYKNKKTKSPDPTPC